MNYKKVMLAVVWILVWSLATARLAMALPLELILPGFVVISMVGAATTIAVLNNWAK